MSQGLHFQRVSEVHIHSQEKSAKRTNLQIQVFHIVMWGMGSHTEMFQFQSLSSQTDQR